MKNKKPEKKSLKTTKKGSSRKHKLLTKTLKNKPHIFKRRTGGSPKKSKWSKTKREKTSIVAKPVSKTKIVRIMGHGQFTIDYKTLKKLNEIDNSLVELVSNDRSDDIEFKRRLFELTNIVEQNGKQLNSREIIQSDIILPSTDLSIDEAKKLFKGEGVIPEI
jgi:hypothetical protein